MCRNIKKLRQPDRAPTEAELHDAALQFVRKVSGFNKPSRTNQDVFDRAVADVARATRRMFDEMTVGARASAAHTHTHEPARAAAS
jgi:hypothetical protein